MRNSKVPKWASLDPDRNLSRNNQIHLRVSKVLMEKVKKSALTRMFPDPKDKNQELNFSSVQDYLEFCIARLERMGSTAWIIFTYT